MPDLKTLYEADTVAWSEHQAAALRAAARTGSNQLLDWENLAEEIESLGKSVRIGLQSQIARIIQHEVKLEHSPALDPRRPRSRSWGIGSRRSGGVSSGITIPRSGATFAGGTPILTKRAAVRASQA